MKKIYFSLLTLVFVSLVITNSVSAKSLKGTIQDLLKSKTARKCTYSINLGKNQKMKGVVYTDNKFYRSEMTIPGEAKPSTTYSLSDGKWLYTWTSMTNQGTKMNLKAMQDMSKKAKTQVMPKDGGKYKEMSKQMQTKYKFNCQNWRVNKNLFKVPKNVTFTDLSKTLEQLQNMGKEIKQKACDVCGSLPDNLKQQCLDSCQ